MRVKPRLFLMGKTMEADDFSLARFCAAEIVDKIVLMKNLGLRGLRERPEATLAKVFLLVYNGGLDGIFISAL